MFPKLRPGLVFFVGEAEFQLDVGPEVKGGPEFIHAEVFDDKIFVFKGGGFGLAADGYHAVHSILIFEDVYYFNTDAMFIKKDERFTTPGATGLNIKDWE